MDSDFQTLLWSLTVSMFPLGGLFGSLMVWPMVNNCGRYVRAVSELLALDLGSDKTHLEVTPPCPALQELEFPHTP